MKKTISANICALLVCFSAAGFAEQWQPLPAESLIQLPANLIEKRIEQDFKLSPIAESINHLEQALLVKGSDIQALQSILEGAGENQMIDEKVQLVSLKSDFLDVMQESQALRQQALDTKVGLYQEVLAEFYAQSQSQQQDMTFELKQHQQAARERMQKVMQQVDANFTDQGFAERTPYASEFAANLAKIEQLKSAIQAHKANLAPTIDGIEVSSQEYVRQLLMQSASDQSLLDQEALMLSYMSRLVALDAQALEYAITLDDENVDAGEGAQLTTPANSVALFL